MAEVDAGPCTVRRMVPANGAARASRDRCASVLHGLLDLCRRLRYVLNLGNESLPDISRIGAHQLRCGSASAQCRQMSRRLYSD